jgi:hypothetical protein
MCLSIQLALLDLTIRSASACIAQRSKSRAIAFSSAIAS